jgi:hypothetical protein
LKASHNGDDKQFFIPEPVTNIGRFGFESKSQLSMLKREKGIACDEYRPVRI